MKKTSSGELQKSNTSFVTKEKEKSNKAAPSFCK